MTFETSYEVLAAELRAGGVGAGRVMLTRNGVIVRAIQGTEGVIITQRHGAWGAEFDWDIHNPDLPMTGNYETADGANGWGVTEVLAWVYPILVGHGLAYGARPLHAGSPGE